MDLTLDKCVEAFLDGEIQEVELTTMPGTFAYIRKLGYYEDLKFKRLAKELRAKLGAVWLDPTCEVQRDIKDDLFIHAEEYLIYHALVHRDGSAFFDSFEEYHKWRESVSRELANELLQAIDEMNFTEDDQKKK